MPLFIFGCTQRLHGCCSALALRAGHGPRNRACKPLGGFHYGSNTPTDGGEATILWLLQGWLHQGWLREGWLREGWLREGWLR